jgi:hypothetical protein
MYLPIEKAEFVLKLLLEGMSIASIERLTDVHHTTILKLLVIAGEKCERIMARKVVNVKVRDIECDELWSFIGKKQKRLRPGDDPNFGDAYVFVGIERHSKLVLNIALGKRDQATTDVFIEGLRHATAPDSFQVTTDGFAPYKTAIPNTLEDRCDFAQLIKVYKAATEGEGRYGPAEVSSVEVGKIPNDVTPGNDCRSRSMSVSASPPTAATSCIPNGLSRQQSDDGREFPLITATKETPGVSHPVLSKNWILLPHFFPPN